ncbi:MAG: hypothetical protein CL477_09545 [Acidobacteria bacterium]|jgi:DUF4097 and DUF4098 domain-containing protein YvlB|nr:hypothetical protein [Acidobacteriota bacterium]MDP7693231.1 DUF4097 family beta strand repeat-containing protein [Vicinamibacterales bacterium]HJN44413.1 DUF4097 family beta strand repeat-containing protein [Vicinamibacterales bacterium]|tara:strand:+ start:8109 stop:9092 length:984 start_codon:yes stop_codon:yes gene_type:complete
MNMWKHIFLTALMGAVVASPVAAQSEQTWSFSGIDRIDLEGTSGDLEIRLADGNELELRLEQNVNPDGAFRGEVEQRGSTLRIREEWGRGRNRGSVRWMLAVPASARPTIAMDTASGDVEAESLNARFEIDTASGGFVLRGGGVLTGSGISTASGDIELSNVTVGDDVDMRTASGDIDFDGVTGGRGFEFKTSSGDVTVRNSTGIVEARSASGNVDIYASEFSGASSFSAASGNVTVELAAIPAQELELSSSSGNVELTAGFGSDFTLVMSKRQDRGRIRSPFAFTSEETYERNGQTYDRKTVIRGSGGPEIHLSTASGNVEVREGR